VLCPDEHYILSLKEMKRFLVSVLLLSYFLVSSGFTVSLHYCMDRFDSAEIGSTNEKKCSKCGMHKDGGCCKDEVVMVKLQSNHLPSTPVISDFSLPALPVFESFFLLASLQNFDPSIISPESSPPPDEGDVYLVNRVFRI